ncbi:MAG: hypothetical protein RIM80_01850 [Alphaproteobacteria bacterium]
MSGSRKPAAPADLKDADLDAFLGGAADSRHDQWIEIQSISSATSRSTAHVKGGVEGQWKIEEGK